ncbi:hypothetical protein LIER_18205 [Lithospermum erythrorhizon]|uniref:Uncharacterized protein n=1 Tax=Lithospermum erythrorhizon TaxID=34254 RepID=A0AAV3QDB2_LITER
MTIKCLLSSKKSFSSEVSVYSLKENSWRQIKPFPYYLKYERSPGVATCGAIHCIIDYIDVWALKEYGKQDSWTKITRINASTFSGDSFGFMRTIAYSVTN